MHEYLVALAFWNTPGERAYRSYMEHGVYIVSAVVDGNALVVTFEDGHTLRLESKA